MFLWRMRSRFMTEIPGQQMDQYKTVSFLEYVSNEVFPLICYSPWPLKWIIFERKWNSSHCQSHSLYVHVYHCESFAECLLTCHKISVTMVTVFLGVLCTGSLTWRYTPCGRMLWRPYTHLWPQNQNLCG